MAHSPITALHENVFRGPYTVSGLSSNIAPDTGLLTSVQDWRVIPTVAWDSGIGDLSVQVELATATAVDTYVIANHTAFTADLESVFVAHKATTGAGWSGAIAGSTHTFISDADVVVTFTQTTDVFFKLHFVEDTNTVAEFSVGELSLGRRIVDFNHGTRPDLNAHGFRVEAFESGVPHGSPVGTLARYSRREFRLNYSEAPGFPESFFADQPTPVPPNFEDLLDHVDLGFPFWFAWNLVDEPYSVFMVRADEANMPLLGSFSRRGLIMNLKAYERIP